MLRMRASTSALSGYFYFSKSDSGLDANELRKEVGGKAAAMLGLSKEPDFEQFKNLLHGLDPHTGEQLTAKIMPGRISYWDLTATVPKGVTIALELGDSRIQEAIWEAGRETMAQIEQLTTTRKRKGGVHEDRVTGNHLWYAFEHPETRPAREDGMPDPDRHIHFVMPNVTFDPVEKEWKAIKFKPVMELRKYFDRTFDGKLASKLTDLGYNVETKYKDGKYHTWDIKSVPQSLVKKFSRRTEEVEKIAKKLGILNPMSKDKLGATSRQLKRKDLTLSDYRRYWQSRITSAAAKEVAELIRTANEGENPEQANTLEKGVAFATSHIYEYRSVAKWTDVAIAAMEYCMGGGRPEDVETEAIRQGVLLKGEEATTRKVLAEEDRIIDFAREGRGTMRPLAYKGQGESGTIPGIGQQKGRPDESKQPSDRITQSPGPSPSGHTAILSPEQQALVSHVLTSPDQVVLVIGDAGTGKTKSVRAAFDAIDCPVEMLAPSAEASRGVLRSEGFKDANTVASFLLSPERQAAVKNGVIWVDEAGLLPIKDLSQLTDVAETQHARLVLQGDPKQHRSVARHGNMMNVLQDYAGIKPGRLTEIWRQRHQGYKRVVADIAAGGRSEGFDGLVYLGWVQKVENHTPVVDEYMAGLKAGKDQLLIAPSHAEGDAITAEIRARLKGDGKLGEDHEVGQLVNLNWSEAQKDDRQRYDGSEILVFHRNTGTLKAGQVVRISDWKPGDYWKNAEHFSVFRESSIPVAAGDVIRITANGKTEDGHELNNGAVYRVKGFNKHGGIVLANGWTVPKTFRHLAHGYVRTSVGTQGKTVDRVLIAMGSASRGAINAEQFYVSVSRARESAKVFSDLAPEELKLAIERTDTRKSANELIRPKRKPSHTRKLIERVRRAYEQLREKAAGAIREVIHQPERESHAR